MRTPSCVILAIIAIAPAVASPAQEERTVQRTRPLLTEVSLVDGGRATASIAVPTDDEYVALAHRIRSAIADATGARLPVISDEEALNDLGSRNLVVIGNLMTNRVAARLYHNYYVAADAAQPGPGIPELRTVHDPEALGIGVVFCGGSDLEGVSAAVERLIEHIKPGSDLRFGHMVEMSVPKLPAPLSAEVLKEKVAAAKPPFGAVDLFVEQGLNYYRSGDPAYLEACKAAIPTLLPSLANETQLNNLYPISYAGPIWDQIEEAPCFTEEERTAICTFLTRCLKLNPRLHELEAPADRPIHYGFAEQGGNLAALYLQRYSPGQPDAVETERRLGHFYRMQSKFWKPANEANGYQSNFAVEIALWALTNGDFTYMDTGSLAKQCEYQMNAIISNVPYNTCFGDSGGTLGGVSTSLLRIATWYYGDGRYQWYLNFLNWAGLNWNLYHAYSTEVAPVEPTHLYGITVVPAEEWCYRAGAEEPGAPPRERAFDKVVFRSRIDRQADYLLLDGLAGFNHGHPDANQIICYVDKGLWALSTGGYMVKQQAEHNMVVAFRDGRGGAEAVPTLCDLELVADMRRVGAVRSTLHEYNGIDWSRNIIWRKGDYFLVIDEMTALQPAEYVLQNWWKLFSPTGSLDGRTFTSGKDTLCRIQGLDTAAVAQRVAMHGKPQYQQAVTQSLSPGQSVAFMNLLQCTRPPHTRAFDARGFGATSAVVRAPDGQLSLLGSRPIEANADISVRAQLYSIEPDAFSLVAATELSCGRPVFAGDLPATVDCDLARGRATFELAAASRVALAADVGPVWVDTRARRDVVWQDGMISLELPAGRHSMRFPPPTELLPTLTRALEAVWARSSVPAPVAPGLSVDAPSMPEMWAVASPEGESKHARVLTQADVTGDGTPELLMGSEDNLLRCVKVDGSVLWQFEAPGPVCSVWVGELTDADGPEVLVGTGTFPGARPGEDIFILDAGGRQIGRIPSPTTPATANEHWGEKPGAIEVITAVDVDGDGKREIIAGSANMHLYCLRPDGEQVWETLNYAHRPNNLQLHDVDGDGEQEIICTTNYWETNLYHLNGEYCFRVKGQGPGLAVGDIDGDTVTEVVTGSLKGPIAVTQYDPALEFTNFLHAIPGIWAPDPDWLLDTGSDVGALRLADLDADGAPEILACSRNSLLYALKADGTILWTRGLGDGIRALEVSDLDADGAPEVLAGNDQGQVFVLSSQGQILKQAQVPRLIQFVCAQDLDGDGVGEVIAASDGPALTAFSYRAGE